MNDPRPTLADVLKRGLRRPPPRPQADMSAPESPLKQRLQQFQTALLREDYADFACQPRYARLIDFFFESLYAPKDFSLRNNSFRALHDWLMGLIGRDPLRVLSQAIELYELTESLDEDMLLALRVQGLEADEPITRPAWEAAYRATGRELDRRRQARLLVENGAILEKAASVPLVHAQLQLVRPAAARLGWGHVIDFLLAGQEAIALARPIDPLLTAIEQRELARIARLLGHGKANSKQ